MESTSKAFNPSSFSYNGNEITTNSTISISTVNFTSINNANPTFMAFIFSSNPPIFSLPTMALIDALVPAANCGGADAAPLGRGTVCVTGAGGYVASWLVKLLLEKGYTVKGTVRNPDDARNAHLKALEGAAERLVLCKADLLDFDALREAVDGCHGVFHTASPVTDDPQMVEPAVRGTRYVIEAAAAAGTVRRVVLTSSVGAVTMDPNRGDDAVVDEACWSDLDFCRNTNNWYCYAKATAERTAWETAGERGVEMAVVIPALVTGPPLQARVNASLAHVVKYLDGTVETYANAVQGYVDVRDVAEAHLRVFEAEGAAGQRFLCIESVLHREDLVGILARLFPQFPIPNKCSDEKKPRKKPYKFSSRRLEELGMPQFTPIHRSLIDMVTSLQEKGLLPLRYPD